MDTTAFLARLDDAFAGDPAEGRPADEGVAVVAARVPGFCTPAELAVLNLAARMLPESEAYLEVGAFKGRSIAGAMVGAPPRQFVAVENYLEFGMIGRAARQELHDNLATYADPSAFRLVEGDCFRVLARPDAVGQDVGVYFYDGAHTSLAHYLALGVVEPLLADEALVLVDDASWPLVRRATQRYVARHPGWAVLRAFEAHRQDDPVWANGLLLLRYRRPAGAARRMAPDVRWRRAVQVHARGPATRVIWKALDVLPGLVPLARRLVPKESRQVSRPR
jgi:predicted O-methyltransferase YrrM